MALTGRTGINATPPSLLPNPPKEPWYVVRLRLTVRALIAEVRTLKRDNAALRRELRERTANRRRPDNAPCGG